MIKAQQALVFYDDNKIILNLDTIRKLSKNLKHTDTLVNTILDCSDTEFAVTQLSTAGYENTFKCNISDFSSLWG
jgi:hypothetical protein